MLVAQSDSDSEFVRDHFLHRVPRQSHRAVMTHCLGSGRSRLDTLLQTEIPCGHVGGKYRRSQTISCPC